LAFYAKKGKKNVLLCLVTPGHFWAGEAQTIKISFSCGDHPQIKMEAAESVCAIIGPPICTQFFQF